ncbi:MAG: tetratricopeptide repeat protein [Hyphomicrobiaceae bacterium]
MAYADSRGLPLSTRSEQAAQRYREGVDLLLSFWPGAQEILQQAIDADPDFALAHAALARLQAIRAEPAEAKAHIATAAKMAERNSTAREQSHIATLSLAVHGQSKKALECTLAHVQTWPRDVIISSLPLGAFGLFAFSGMADHDQARVDLCEAMAPHFDADDWWFLTYRGWAHVENGNVGYGRNLTEHGFELRKANATGAHALAHALFEHGAGGDAEALLDDWLPSYDRSGTLHGHLAWHRALSALERGDPEAALAVYGRHVKPAVSLGLPINIVTDSVSLLWRLRAYGYDVPPDLWSEAKHYAERCFPNAGHSFIDTHMGLLAAATGDTSSAGARIDALTRLVEQGTLAAGPVVPAICRAALAFIDGDYAKCVELLQPVRHEVVRIGGSHAQREVIEDTLLIALLRSGKAGEARALLDHRLHRRPSPRDSRWQVELAA